MTLDELEACTRQQLAAVAGCARKSGDLTAVMNEAAEAILLGAIGWHDTVRRRNKKRKKSQVTVIHLRPRTTDLVHFAAPCYLDTEHECHGSLACDAACLVAKGGHVLVTSNPRLVTCGSCKRSKIWRAAA
jgi:hypothetical protein